MTTSWNSAESASALMYPQQILLVVPLSKIWLCLGITTTAKSSQEQSRSMRAFSTSQSGSAPGYWQSKIQGLQPQNSLKLNIPRFEVLRFDHCKPGHAQPHCLKILKPIPPTLYWCSSGLAQAVLVLLITSSDLQFLVELFGMEFHRPTFINPLNYFPAEISLKIFSYPGSSEPQELINLLLVNRQFYKFCKAHEEALVRGACHHPENRLDWSLVLKDNPTFGALLSLKRRQTSSNRSKLSYAYKAPTRKPSQGGYLAKSGIQLLAATFFTWDFCCSIISPIWGSKEKRRFSFTTSLWRFGQRQPFSISTFTEPSP